VCAQVLGFLTEIAGFVEKYRQIPVYYIPKPEGEVVDATIKGKYVDKIRGKALAREKNNESKKKETIMENAKQIINLLCESTTCLPKPEDIPTVITALPGEMGSDKDPSLKQSMTRILRTLNEPVEPRLQEIEEGTLSKGFHVQLIKNHLMGAVWYTSTRVHNVASLFSSCLLSFEPDDACYLHYLGLLDVANQVRNPEFSV